MTQYKELTSGYIVIARGYYFVETAESWSESLIQRPNHGLNPLYNGRIMVWIPYTTGTFKAHKIFWHQAKFTSL